MPRFKNLSNAIQFQINETTKNIQIPNSSILSLSVGQNIENKFKDDSLNGVLRWGFSTWGVENVSTINKPTTTTASG